MQSEDEGAPAAPATAPVEGKPKTAKRKAKKETNWVDELKHFALLALAVAAIWSFIGKPFYIPSESMVPTLLTGDRLWVSKYPYGYSYLSPLIRVLPEMKGRLFGSYPTRGDVVVLKDPVHQEDWIKRVIGLPGDTVQMREGTLYLNGKAIPKQRISDAPIAEDANMPCDPAVPQYNRTLPDGTHQCAYPRYVETLPNGRQYVTIDMGQTLADDTPPYVIPDGSVFLMGDNRDRSADSRVAPSLRRGMGGLGILPVENISGRAEFITFSLDGTFDLFNPVSWFTSFRGNRAWISLRHLPDDVEAELNAANAQTMTDSEANQ